ncbi:transcription-repair coupling factor [Prevotella sp. OH937_COT-195]|uniref:transcription-repair coupling factor n=1 Tax=Prevotella sp. OH937_COT-195 TaxID=2491051 RepID=UPI000F6480CF|nr:transcription-repair coupling factor [Prevotella sp. OH937_COT-195]RRD02705.1 transcription-repair coupling factor [Prevotella sp. OH937_COT-195]
MEIKDLLAEYAKSRQVSALAHILEDKSSENVFLQGLMASAAPVMFAAAATKVGKTVLFILQDADEAAYFYNDLKQMMGADQVFFFPSSYRRQVKYGQRDPANEILRTEVLTKLQTATDTLYIVSEPSAVAELVVSKRILDERSISLGVGQTVDTMQLRREMRNFGFSEVDYVYEPGQFATRGSIVDVFSYSSEYPFRIDFFGDEIDSIRTFEVKSQLSRERKEKIRIVPEMATLTDEKTPFLQFLPEDTVIAMKDFMYVRETTDRIYREGFSQQAMAERMEGLTEMEQERLTKQMKAEHVLCSGTQFTDDALHFRRIEFGTKPTGTPQVTIKFDISPQPLLHKNFDLLKQTLEDYTLKGYKLFILSDSTKQQERLKEIVSDTFEPVSPTIHEGFADNSFKVCLFTDHQIFDRFHRYSLKSDAARAGKMALTMKELQEMEIGDFVVHVDFGVGKFAGLVRTPVGQSYQEAIRIVYQNNDKIDVSIHSLYKISKYRRHDTDRPPRLSNLGTGAWDRMKERTKKKIKDIARDLIKLYAARRRERGHAFAADSFMQHELEASFLYEDTPDQLKATNDVKADMEDTRPMDRLVCGDVGFGKTEVAVRAAFKAACDSKQVAVMVPTTVLAYQHYQTFKKRLKGMPVRVDYLSRARSAKQVKQVLDDLEQGKIDIIIGTHKLIGKTVKFKDLGLLIIDEEQKFGVSVKEKLRKMKTNVDTLTMSATPIPRTLQFSLMGARDMSIIQTPPPNRFPVQTEVHAFDKDIIIDAINFEMSRNGQVFFVSDRINTLPEMANLINRNIPDARMATGHGQMKPEELEKTIMGFMNYDYDVLLSTTIVENGIDISNANTIIINDAHRFGLSDLHQMRGRVGRSNKKAFCYLLAPPLSSLSQDARRRLEALETFSELGSGFNLSMQDLDIRGAGNLLGAEQSGFMEDLGYETYQKILTEAMVELREEETETAMKEEAEERDAGKVKSTHRDTTNVNGNEGYWVADCAIESDLEMYFPDTYVPSSSERMLLYRELDLIKNNDDLKRYRANLIDRFGPMPREGEELLQVVALRRVGRRLGCEKVMMKNGQMTLYFPGNTMSRYFQSRTFGRVIDYMAENTERCRLRETPRRSMIISEVKSVGEAVDTLRKIVSAG